MAHKVTVHPHKADLPEAKTGVTQTMYSGALKLNNRFFIKSSYERGHTDLVSDCQSMYLSFLPKSWWPTLPLSAEGELCGPGDTNFCRSPVESTEVAQLLLGTGSGETELASPPLEAYHRALE
ncbi:unnamed protein product [Rangifer tarandus platyrhynchus]|uniref:Uncharacterized protein n=1 Tax=Rangifer tarandus platyrhynchus TaxID=3082113 RepID=A0ABN8ZXS3_RANTA|nr:unnamed protein product [Rangifer tarandus platyrhynchus]